MAISFIGKADASNNAAGQPALVTSLALTPHASTTTGDVMIAQVHGPDATQVTLTIPAGWTLIDNFTNVTGTNFQTALYYRVADGTDPKSQTWGFTPAGSGAAFAIGVATFRGVDTGSPINAHSQKSTTTTQNPTANPVTTTVDNCCIWTSRTAVNNTTALAFTASAPTNAGTHLADYGQNDGSKTRRTGTWFDSTQVASGSNGGFIIASSNAVTAGVMFTLALAPATVPISNADSTAHLTEGAPQIAFTGTGDSAASATQNQSIVASESDPDVANSLVQNFSINATRPATGANGDTGTVTESQSILASFTTATETATATDSGTVRIPVSSSDTATGTEATNTIVSRFTDADATAHGTDTGTVTAAINGSDSGSGTDTGIISSLAVQNSDTSTATEAHSIVASLSDDESATNRVTEGQSIDGSTSPVGFDAMSVTESSWVTSATVLNADTLAGTETNGILASFTSTDAAAITDAAGTHVPSTSPTDTETATISENQTIVVRFSSSDSCHIDGHELPPNDGTGPRIVDGTSDLVLGPATMYLGAFQATEPLNGDVDDDPDPAVWMDLGGILDGASLEVTEEYDLIELAQMPDSIIRRLKKRDLRVKVQLAEPTLLNLGYALNGGDTASGAGYRSITPSTTVDAGTPLTYNAVMIKGWAPGPGPYHKNLQRMIIMRKCLSIDNVEFAYAKDGQTTYTVTWAVHYVSATVPPFKVIDQA